MDSGEDGRRDDPAVGLSRRAYLTAVGGGLVGSLAGCSEPNEIVDSPQVFGYQFPYDPETTHVSPWSTSDPSAFYSLLFETETVHAPGGRRRLADVVSSVEADGTTATVEYAEDFSWWSGDPVTARDRWVHERIQSYVSEDTPYEVDLADEYTLRYDLDRPLDRPLLLTTVVGDMVRTRADYFMPFLERLRDAATERTRRQVIGDLRSASPGLETVAEEGLGCGPYEVVEVSINRVMLERYDDHPRADAVEIPRLWFPVVQQVSIENLIDKGWLDGGMGRLERQRGDPPANLEQLAQYRTNSGTKLVLDWRNRHLARTGVRRAILAALPVGDVAETTALGDPAVRHTGMAAPAERRWLPGSVREGLHRYPLDSDEEAASAHMRSAGYSRDENGTWRDADGHRARLRLGTPVWDDFVTASSVVSSSLDRFGFDVTTDRIPNTNIHYDVSNHNYDMMLWSFDGRPYTVYDVTNDGATSIGYGVTDADATRSSQGKPVVVDVPETPGDIDAPETERRSVNLVETWRAIERPSDRATTVDAISTFATWWNAALPDIAVTTTVAGLWGNTRDFSWPAYDSDARYGTAGPADDPIFHMLKQGAVAPAADE